MIKGQDLGKVLAGAMKKYKYAILVLLLGLVLLMIPGSSEKKQTKEVMEESKTLPDLQVYVEQMEGRLEQALSNISGIGEVEVILSPETGFDTRYLYDVHQSDSKSDNGTTNSEERKTVILSQGNAYDEAVVTSVRFPQFQGAVLICQGEMDAQLRLLLTEAVSALTGLRSDKISIVSIK